MAIRHASRHLQTLSDFKLSRSREVFLSIVNHSQIAQVADAVQSRRARRLRLDLCYLLLYRGPNQGLKAVLQHGFLGCGLKVDLRAVVLGLFLGRVMVAVIIA